MYHMANVPNADLPATAPTGDQTTALQNIEQFAPKGWRVRLAKAATQLIAGSEKGAVAYGEIRERLDTIEGRSIVAKGMAEAVMQQSINDPEIMERAKARFLGSVLQKQENLEAVIAGAVQPLLALPPPTEEITATAKETTTDTENAPSEGTSSLEQPLNADWAATFTGIVENATSDELRSRLSLVLAGELASPGSYSRATVRQIAELEKPDLEAMQRVLGYVIGDIVIRLDKGETQEPSIDMLLPLAEAGLVTEASNIMVKNWSRAPEDGTILWFSGKSWAIKVTLKKGQMFSIPMTQLTRTGVAVVDLLGRSDEKSILESFVETMAADSFLTVEIGQCISPDLVALPLKRLRPAPVANTVLTSQPTPFGAPTITQNL